MNKRSGAESKKRILDVAMRVFSEHGYSKASMRIIAKASGISIGGLYIYFKNKEDLYLTLVKSRLDDLAASCRRAGPLHRRRLPGWRHPGGRLT